MLNYNEQIAIFKYWKVILGLTSETADALSTFVILIAKHLKIIGAKRKTTGIKSCINKTVSAEQQKQQK